MLVPGEIRRILTSEEGTRHLDISVPFSSVQVASLCPHMSGQRQSACIGSGQ